MPTLKDYLGSLVKDLNYARVIADVESANIAKMYAEHDLLKYFSIPRMKIQETELTIPIAISELEESTAKEYQPIDNTAFYTATYAEIKNTFGATSFSRDVSAQMRKEIYAQIAVLEQTIKSGESIAKPLDTFCTKISDFAIKAVKGDERERAVFDEMAKHTKLSDEQIKTRLTENLVKFLKPEIRPREVTGKIENARVIVESGKLREEKPENLLYIKLKITEESMEWQTMEDAEGNVVKKLMIE